jgi:prevent-host-death family protein
MERIGIRELRQNASAYLRRVEAGECFEITDHGRPVALLQPYRKMSTIERMIAEGRIIPAKRPWTPPEPLPMQPGEKPVSELLQEMRDAERW